MKFIDFDADSLPATSENHRYSYNFQNDDEIKYNQILLDSHYWITRICVKLALKHAATAMFVTSATTAVAFLTNCFSNIVILRWVVGLPFLMGNESLWPFTPLKRSLRSRTGLSGCPLESDQKSCPVFGSRTSEFFWFGTVGISQVSDNHDQKRTQTL